MKVTTRTKPRIGDVRRRRRRKKQPDPRTLLRVEWLKWLVSEYGAEHVADWQTPPVSFRDWCRSRELEAHEAA
ncbi:MAG: hypothetical protein OER88_07270 [Planctomycetota bacterium]|nr:hypothetical protein [Planctomycetota bacterium]